MKTAKNSFFALATFALSAPVLALAADRIEPGNYAIDPMHTKVGFEVPHLVISSVEGRFNAFSGELQVPAKVEDSKLTATIETSSVDTGIGQRDEHLRSADFFDAKKYPKMTFQARKIAMDGNAMKVTGDLTIKGNTRQVTLDGRYLGAAKDAYGNQKIAFTASTKISRKDFGLTWNKAVEAGPVVGDEITISLKVQAAKAQAQAKK